MSLLLSQKVFERDSWEVLVLSTYFQSLVIKSTIDLYILLWLTEGEFSFSSNDIEEYIQVAGICECP